MPASPRSPDVQIYRPQLTSVLSIAHRVTGIWLSLGSVLLVAWLATVAAGAHAALHTFFGSVIGALLLFTWTFALFYHLCNGIRHLGWDLDYGFELHTIYRTGWLVVAASIGLTLVTWAIALATIMG
jgi:succinate dehydrogenase / fumarate reductase cytochrome b subunit